MLQALGVGGTAAAAGCASKAPTVDLVAADPTDVPDPVDRDGALGGRPEVFDPSPDVPASEDEEGPLY